VSDPFGQGLVHDRVGEESPDPRDAVRSGLRGDQPAAEQELRELLQGRFELPGRHFWRVEQTARRERPLPQVMTRREVFRLEGATTRQDGQRRASM
jgi:hypothetical protein